MKIHGTLRSYEPYSGSLIFSVGKLDEYSTEQLMKLQNVYADIEVKAHKEHRSLDANKMLWACLGDIASKTGRSPWEEYLDALKKYGKFSYIICRKNAVDMMKKQWREIQEVGDYHFPNGEEGVQLICFYGSSTYDSKDFSHLLEGVVSDMKDLGLPLPPSKDMKRALERLGEADGKNG